MDNLEKAEKIREKTGVSYEDAKKALEACNYDMLDAICYLEALGKINGPQMGSYTTGYNDNTFSYEFANAQENYEKSCKGGSGLGDTLDKFFSWAGRMIKRSWEIKFRVFHKGEKLLELPLLIVIVTTIVAFWLTVILLLIGLFCDCNYRFVGVDSVSVDLNSMSDRASSFCEDIKKDFQNNKNNNNN